MFWCWKVDEWRSCMNKNPGARIPSDSDLCFSQTNLAQTKTIGTIQIPSLWWRSWLLSLHICLVSFRLLVPQPDRGERGRGNVDEPALKWHISVPRPKIQKPKVLCFPQLLKLKKCKCFSVFFMIVGSNMASLSSYICHITRSNHQKWHSYNISVNRPNIEK